MTRDSDIELIRALSPLDDGPSDQARDDARAALRAQLDNDRRAEPGLFVRRLRLPLLPISIGLATALAVGTAVVLLISTQTGSVLRPDPAAAAVLQRAALAAEAAGGPRTLRAGEYWYVHSRDTRLGVDLGSPGHSIVIVDAYSSEDRQVWKGRVSGVGSRLGPSDRFSSFQRALGSSGSAPTGRNECRACPTGRCLRTRSTCHTGS